MSTDAPTGSPTTQAKSQIEPQPSGDTPQFDINRVRPETGFVDVMGGDARQEIRIGEHGFIALVDAMPRLVPEGQTGDAAIVQAARVSYGAGTKKVNEDRGLIRYLLRHRHTTPFEMVELKFHVSMPVFVARQWIRHRTANVNEYSARYSVVPDRFYRPPLDGVRKQSSSNRQGGEQPFDLDNPTEAKTAQEYLAFLDAVEAQYATYEKLLEAGVSRELARAGLPVNVYTEWYWKCDLHNTLRFLSLRIDSHAQKEIRDFAQAMLALIEPIVPMTVEAWRDYELGGVHLTRLEVEALRTAGLSLPKSLKTISSDNRREQSEWADKLVQLGLSED
ncbi:MAG: FAD-dependent thymidylate synthase [Planctomycetota bacterium]